MSFKAQRPRLLFFGTGGEAVDNAKVLQADLGTTDNGNAFSALATSNPIVVVRPSQEMVCYATYVTISHLLATPSPVTVRLLCDSRPPLEATFEIPVTTELTVSSFEVGWAEVLTGAELRVTQAPRAKVIRSSLALAPCGTGEVLDVEGVECEIEIREESSAPVNATP